MLRLSWVARRTPSLRGSAGLRGLPLPAPTGVAWRAAVAARCGPSPLALGLGAAAVTGIAAQLVGAPRKAAAPTKCESWLGASRPKKRIAILGGAFDPITNSHLTCASEIVHSGKADEVWLVPCGARPDKPKLKTPGVDRYCMCQIAINTAFSARFPIKVSDAECFLPEAAFTYDLLCNLRDKHPDSEFIFVIGSDWLQPSTDMRQWDSLNPDWKPGMPKEQKTIITGHKMIQEFEFLVLKRPGCEVESTNEDPTGLKKFGPRLSWLSMENMTFIEGNLSSTEIRKRTSMWRKNAAGQEGPSPLDTIDGLVPPGVLAYIYRTNLYSS